MRRSILDARITARSFVSVTDRFTRELEQIERGLIAKDGEARIEHIILGMRFLRFQTYPMEAFEEAAEFTETLAIQFDAASGSRIKIAFATALNALFSSVVESATAEVNHPLWARAMQTIHAKAMAMTAKPRYWPAAIPLVCTVVAAAPQDFLLANWQACVDLCMAKLKVRRKIRGEADARRTAPIARSRSTASSRSCGRTCTGVTSRTRPSPSGSTRLSKR